jgi:hypothetical protein
MPEATSTPSTVEPIPTTSNGTFTPTTPLTSSNQDAKLSVISPIEGISMRGGEKLLIALHLVDHDDLSIENAMVQAELWHPNGELYASLPCVDKGKGHYRSEYMSLPLREASGTWRVVGEATWQDGQRTRTEGTFQANLSISEMYESRYGFWIEHPHVYGLGTGFYNLQETGGLHFEDWLHEDGSGYVILDNYRYVVIGVTFATLEVHWQDVDFPVDEGAAIAHADSLGRSGLHHQDPDVSLTKLTAEMVMYQDRSTWHVLGQGSEYYVAPAAAEYPVEWLIFQCPGSDWLWSLIISSDNVGYMDHLRGVQKTFACPQFDPN